METLSVFEFQLVFSPNIIDGLTRSLRSYLTGRILNGYVKTWREFLRKPTIFISVILRYGSVLRIYVNSLVFLQD
ncbi:MAG: hypothetical protein ACUVQY_06890 [Thermoproteota archaeon]